MIIDKLIDIKLYKGNSPKGGNLLEIAKKKLLLKQNHQDIYENPKAITFIKNNLHEFNTYVDWRKISKNTNSLSLLVEEFNKNNYSNNLDWLFISYNPDNINLIRELLADEKLKYFINFKWLSKNSNAIDIIEEKILTNFNSVDWGWLSSNPSAIDLLNKYPHMIDWGYLSSNPSAIHLIEKELKNTPNRVSWCMLSSNPSAIHLIEEELKNTPNAINWGMLSGNPNAIHLIKNELEINPKSKRINPHMLSENININYLPEEIFKRNNLLYISFKNPCIFDKLSWSPENIKYFPDEDRKVIIELFLYCFYSVLPKEISYKILYMI